MRTFEELEALYVSQFPAGRTRGDLALIVARLGGGLHETPGRAQISVTDGLVGDRWTTSGAKRDPESQLTLMNRHVAAFVAAGRQPLHMAGDNLLVDVDLAETCLPVGARIRIGAVTLEVTAKLHAGCKKFSERFGPEALRWVNWHDHRDRRLRGVNCKVLEGGELAVGETVEIVT